jgi:hypothetical protein
MAKLRLIQGGLPETPRLEASLDEAAFMQHSIQPLTPEAFYELGYKATEGFDRAQAETIIPIREAYNQRNQQQQGGAA